MRANEDMSRVESEAAIIATLIHHPDFSFYSEQLLPNHFTNKENRIIYQALRSLAQSGVQTIDPYAVIYARSGLASKQGLRPANCTGVIDCSYRGEWIVALHNDSAETRIVHNGDRIAQFAVLPVLDSAIEEVDGLSETDRGTGGFESTGK